MTISS